ncbi:hypothetical protein VCRA2110O318_230043 [Vibrio crassostreae]|nr:hypothetical protein VCRA2117O328_60180 [Vibrio crassostreae]CAK2304501.1 hypothetical protein VCRA2110O318_230043 [Vibrio crassostreae]CAK2532371.1 hypothetical protein VCRA2110O319_80043 [Vibrio crassostreae]CAK2796169.1 hypothetical protein VCRA217O317_250028 [Vibrio crassostreae]
MYLTTLHYLSKQVFVANYLMIDTMGLLTIFFKVDYAQSVTL